MDKVTQQPVTVFLVHIFQVFEDNIIFHSPSSVRELSRRALPQVCCPREDAWDSVAGAVNSPRMQGIAQSRIIMRNDFDVRPLPPPRVPPDMGHARKCSPAQP